MYAIPVPISVIGLTLAYQRYRDAPKPAPVSAEPETLAGEQAALSNGD